MRAQKFILLSSLILFLFNGVLLAQITVNINSGNPTFPFPQFLAYENPTQKLGNLATNNPVGVCHAEMEKSIREAYQIMMNRANKTGTTLSGVDYIKFTSTPDCSEGDGYALLAAAAMADKTTFDGLWLWVHDNALNKDTSYSTGQPSAPYIYSSLVGWQNTSGSNSAADGDADIALALLTAYMQWGEFMGINHSRGNPISYKHDLIEFLKGMTDTIPYSQNGGTTYICGDIGMDGYIKGGDTWTELTNWASNTAQSGFLKPPEYSGPQTEYIDYAAPSYFHEFANFLSQENPSLYTWNISQFQRCEASSDWIMGQFLANPKGIPFAGHITLPAGTVLTFENVESAEDMRLAWRTILNSVWHGDPATTWDPVAHQVIASTTNTFERDIGQRYAKLLWDTRQSPWNNSCVTVANSTHKYWGPSVLVNGYSILGIPTSPFFLNWVPGTGSPSAVISQDFNLMAELYRTCEIEWDAEVVGDGYLTSVPRYFHEWFRLFGMLLLSGNYSAPSIIKPIANMKVYLDVDKTCAMKGDTISYAISYRNYGSLDAQNVVVTDTIPNDLSFLSCTGGGTYQSSSRIVSWTIGTVPGSKTASGIAPTTGEVSLKVSLAAISQKQYANKVSISCENGSGWTSNEYPNKVSSVLKRNFVDVINKPITGGDSVATVNTLHGGRPGVHFSFSTDSARASPQKTMSVRLFHDAQEPYINYGNYRISYFLFDTIRTGLAGQNGNSNGWVVTPLIVQGLKNLTILQQNLVSGSDNRGKWNQRIIFQFSDTANPGSRDTNWSTMATINRHLETYSGMSSRIHRGQLYPLELQWSLASANSQSIKWDDDWSWDSSAIAATNDPGYPITPDFTDPAPENPGIAVKTLNPKYCDSAVTTVDNILVEEWDGYVWRTVFGNSPASSATPVSRSSALYFKPLSFMSISRSEIKYFLPLSGKISLRIFDMKGRIIATLVDAFQKAGPHSVKYDKKNLGSSVYTLRLVSEKEFLSKKIVFVD